MSDNIEVTIKKFERIEDFLAEKLKYYREFGNVDFSFQEYVEAMFMPTSELRNFFIANNLTFVENIYRTTTKERKYYIANWCIIKSYQVKD